jgi:hypothetical protein
MSNYHRAPQGAPVYDPYELGVPSTPYSTQVDYLPIPAGAMGTLFDPERLKKGYVAQEIGDAVHYVTSGAYDEVRSKTGLRHNESNSGRDTLGILKV